MLISKSQAGILVKPTVAALALVLSAQVAHAHVVVSPTVSEPGKKETYTFSVPTEGASATTSVELEVPADVLILSVGGPDSEHSVTKEEGRGVRVIWHVQIPPGAGKQLTLVAQNPAAPIRGIRWKVHQSFADGTRADWVDPPPARPAPQTRLLQP